MIFLDDLMRRCREDGHNPTYQDLVALHAEVADLEKDRDRYEAEALELAT